jgi:hypothetical protein
MIFLLVYIGLASILTVYVCGIWGKGSGDFQQRRGRRPGSVVLLVYIVFLLVYMVFMSVYMVIVLVHMAFL